MSRHSAELQTASARHARIQQLFEYSRNGPLYFVIDRRGLDCGGHHAAAVSPAAAGRVFNEKSAATADCVRWALWRLFDSGNSRPT